MPDIAVELLPRQLLIRCNDDFCELLFAQSTIFVIHEETDAQAALGADIGMAAGS